MMNTTKSSYLFIYLGIGAVVLFALSFSLLCAQDLPLATETESGSSDSLASLDAPAAEKESVVASAPVATEVAQSQTVASSAEQDSPVVSAETAVEKTPRSKEDAEKKHKALLEARKRGASIKIAVKPQTRESKGSELKKWAPRKAPNVAVAPASQKHTLPVVHTPVPARKPAQKVEQKVTAPKPATPVKLAPKAIQVVVHKSQAAIKAEAEKKAAAEKAAAAAAQARKQSTSKVPAVAGVNVASAVPVSKTGVVVAAPTTVPAAAAKVTSTSATETPVVAASAVIGTAAPVVVAPVTTDNVAPVVAEVPAANQSVSK